MQMGIILYQEKSAPSTRCGSINIFLENKVAGTLNDARSRLAMDNKYTEFLFNLNLGAELEPRRSRIDSRDLSQSGNASIAVSRTSAL